MTCRHKLQTPQDERTGLCEACRAEVAADPKIVAKNDRAEVRQREKDAFIADHPELVDSSGIFTGEAEWQAFAAAQAAE